MMVGFRFVAMGYALLVFLIAPSWLAAEEEPAPPAPAAALEDAATTVQDAVPDVPDVPPEVLVPRRTWADPAAYDEQARKLARMFQENFEQYRSGVSEAVAAAGPVKTANS